MGLLRARALLLTSNDIFDAGRVGENLENEFGWAEGSSLVHDGIYCVFARVAWRGGGFVKRRGSNYLCKAAGICERHVRHYVLGYFLELRKKSFLFLFFFFFCMFFLGGAGVGGFLFFSFIERKKEAILPKLRGRK